MRAAEDSLKILGLQLVRHASRGANDWPAAGGEDFDIFALGERFPNSVPVLYGTSSAWDRIYKVKTSTKGEIPITKTLQNKNIERFLNKLVKHALKIAYKFEKQGVEIPSPVGQYLFHFTAEETIKLIEAQVPASKASYCRGILKVTDLDKIIAWRDMPYEWIDLLSEHT